MDISIIKYFGGHYICKYRSGIVGAGNALTYAYMCALAHDFLSRNKPNEVTGTDIRNFIDNIIRKDNDRFLINKMFDAVEQYKRGTKPKVKNESSNAEDIKGFTSFITNLYKGSGYQPLSEDAQEWINATINIIKEEVKNALKITTSDDIGKINYVYYTGRAFRCKNFKQSIDQFLRSEILEEDTTELNERIRKLSIENYDKILCLFIRIALYRGACSDNTFCLPFVCHQSLGVNDPWGIIEILNNLFTNRKENKDNIVSTFSSIMASPLVTSRYFIPSSTPYEYYDRGMRLGFEITFSKSDQLLYNGNYFSLDPKDKMSGKVRLFMLDGEMYVRLSNNAAHRTSEKTCIKFRDDHINLSTSPLKFGTFFPNINQEEETVIIEPRDSSNVNEDSIAAVQKESKSHHDETLNNNESYSSQFQ